MFKVAWRPRNNINECFADILNLLNVCEEEENSISRQFIEWVINRLELAAKFVENVLPFVNEREEESPDHLKDFVPQLVPKFKGVGD